MKLENKNKTQLKRELDKVFSLYIRKSWANDLGQVACYTCGKVDDISKMQCGHYISRSHMNTRWDENNCRVQCYSCNICKSGNYAYYAERLQKELGDKNWKKLMKKRDTTTQWTKDEMIKEILKYRKKLEEL